MEIAVIGAGSWGTAISNLLAEKGYNIKLWARDKRVAEAINEKRRNPKYLRQIKDPKGRIFEVVINERVVATSLEEALFHAEVISFVVPSHALRDIALKVKVHLKGKPLLISLTKGLEFPSLKRMSEVLLEVFPDFKEKIAVLSGPSHAEEVSQHIPTAAVISSFSSQTANQLQEIFITPYFRVYTNTDIIGVELGAAIKNVIAIAAGISDGLGYGDNTKASLMTRGLTEMTRLGVAMGGRAETFAGLSGIGDLIATCTSKYSRNRAVGEMLAAGLTLPEITSRMQMIAEGIKTAQVLKQLAEIYQLKMPISEAVAEIIYEGKSPQDCVQELMQRPATDEEIITVGEA